MALLGLPLPGVVDDPSPPPAVKLRERFDRERRMLEPEPERMKLVGDAFLEFCRLRTGGDAIVT